MFGKITIAVKNDENGHSVSISGLLVGADRADKAIILADLCDAFHADPTDVVGAYLAMHLMDTEADT